MRWLLIPVLPLGLALVLAASPEPDGLPLPGDSPEEIIRQANAAFLRGDPDTAESLYKSAEERSEDPGLVAFNQAAILFQRGDFHGAEVHYARVVDDRACPPIRAARAWFNRGACLIRQGSSAADFRSAAACLENCLESQAADEPLKADARHNLELAKLLWAQANKKAATPETPNFPTQEEDRPERQQSHGGIDPGQEDPGAPAPGKSQPPPAATPAVAPVPMENASGANRIPADVPNPRSLLDESTPQKLTEAETREYLKRTEHRLREERRRMLRILYGPYRPGIRDW